MSKNSNFQEALHNSLQIKQPPSVSLHNKEIKKLVIDLPIEAHMQIERMKLDLRRNTMRELVRDAINDFFNKHNYPPIA